jgi:hypothetical protein
MKRGRFAAFVVLIMTLLMVVPITALDVRAADSGPQESTLINIRLDGPSVVGTGVATDFSIQVSYVYPERIQEYSYKAKIVGTSTTGAKIAPDNGTDTGGLFSAEITGPSSIGKIKIEINATAKEGDVTWFRVKDFEINVVEPVYVDAVILNNGPAAANNISVDLIIDGSLKETKRYNLSSNGSASVNFTWVFSSIPQGKHTVTLVIDSQYDLVEFSRGDNVITIDVYYSDSGNPLRGIFAIMIIFVGVILFLTILMKGGKKK